jgi:factor associated with neutral sphingomyelinase activation
MCLSADGATLFTVSQDSSLKVYSVNEKKQLRSTNLSEMALSSCQLAPDEKTVIVGSWDNNMYPFS